jgi:hypothetical protein
MDEDFVLRRRVMQQRIERAKVGLIRAAVGVVGSARGHAEHDDFLAIAVQEWERAWDAYIVNGIEMAALVSNWPSDDSE